ncbi:MAG: phage tail sheath family protein [Desulfobulbaceae bacterium]|nr:phage tail sheath family protein [Desulfobulbaceae bacterium]
MTHGFDKDIERFLSPGVHLKRIDATIGSSLQTAVPLFVGSGETKDPQSCESAAVESGTVYRIHSFDHFELCFSVSNPHGFLDYAVRGFFENGGKQCLVYPVKNSGDDQTMLQNFDHLFNSITEPEIKKSVLFDITDVDLVCTPDIITGSDHAAQSDYLKVQNHVLEYCKELEDRFAILDVPATIDRQSTKTPFPISFAEHQPVHIIRRLSDLKRRGRDVEGAMYFPWIYVKPMSRHRDQIGRLHVPVPPCGHVAGVYARSDAMHGVHKAPANEIIEGAVDLTFSVSDTEQTELNRAGINCLRSFPGRGIRVWGGRTLSTQPQWKFINIRRLFITLRRWIEYNMVDIVFEPNEPPLWDKVADRLGAYCFELYQRGALKGNRPSEAFFVKCNAETNPPVSREAGRLICEIGLAPVAPAEFIIVRIVQSIAATKGTILTTI